MKKLSLAIIIVMFSMSLVACTNSAGTNINNAPGTNTSIDSEITIDKAKEIALEHAGLIESKVSFVKAEKDIDAGVEKYEIEFYCDGKEYDYEISAIDGSIIKYDHEIENGNNVNNGASNTQGNMQNNAANNASSNMNSTGNISVDEAKRIALSHAGLTSSQVTFKRTELEVDNGVQKYEIEFYYNNREYSYEISANTGAILSYEQD